jgi:predicted phage terminase large subunit-like protein
VAAGQCRRLLLTMPPRHGKSEFASKYFPAWFLGTQAHKRVILASYEADFASSWGRKVRDLLSEHGPECFGISIRSDSSAADRWEIDKHGGGMQTAGVGGPITGKGADLLVIDDPVKNAEEAQSPTYREKQWDWFTSTAYTRLEPGAAVVLIQTRWHADDLAGRILANPAEPWEVINLPALAEDDDPLGRQPGEALWPNRYDADALGKIKATIGTFWFSALYQQRPTPREGSFFKRHWFGIVEASPAEARRCRYWDKAATDGGGDWTAGCRVSKAPSGVYYIEDMKRARLNPGDRDRLIRQTAETDGRECHVVGEQEPGSAGKDAALAFVRMLDGFRTRCEPASGSKEVRADAMASQAEAGNVKLVRGPWVNDFLDELTSFPKGEHDDQVDAASGAFNFLSRVRSGGAF